MQTGKMQQNTQAKYDPAERDIRAIIKREGLVELLDVPEEHIVKVMLLVKDSFDVCRQERLAMM